MENINDKNKPISFISANGFPTECYSEFLDPLKESCQITPFLLRPLWRPKESESNCKHWSLFTTDYLNHLNEEYDESNPVIGIGHSIGATVVLDAAIKEPHRFSKLILIEPALFTIKMSLTYRFFKMIGLSHHIHPMIKRTKNRHTLFESKEEMIGRLRKKASFKKISDQNLKFMVDAMLEKRDDNNYDLRWSKEWEIEIYDTCCTLDFGIWRNLPKLKIPVQLLIADQSNTFFESTKKRFLKAKPDTQCEVVENASHLLPFEYPKNCLELLSKYIDIS